jgi:hypothetical protein
MFSPFSAISSTEKIIEGVVNRVIPFEIALFALSTQTFYYISFFTILTAFTVAASTCFCFAFAFLRCFHSTIHDGLFVEDNRQKNCYDQKAIMSGETGMSRSCCRKRGRGWLNCTLQVNLWFWSNEGKL